MTSRERVKSALKFQPVDCIPLEYHPCLRGLYEHGDSLRQLIKAIPGDFEDFSNLPAPVVPKDAYDTDGSYHEYKTDAWGVEWEYRIFSMTGHPKTQPLQDITALKTYQAPKNQWDCPENQQKLNQRIADVKQYGYAKMGWCGFFEIMHALRPFEDVLMDIYEDTPEINQLADLIVSYQEKEIAAYLKAAVDGIQFGDDFGTTCNLLIDPDTWRRFFKPRYQRLIKPIRAAGCDVFFHTCGYCQDILPDLKEIGVDAVWPQLTAYKLEELADSLRQLGLACAIHIDRAQVMTNGTPDDVRKAVQHAAKAFDVQNGGSWFYVETDHGFPLENIQALLDSIQKYR